MNKTIYREVLKMFKSIHMSDDEKQVYNQMMHNFVKGTMYKHILLYNIDAKYKRAVDEVGAEVVVNYLTKSHK